jgi:hypothetical protein
MKLAAGPFDLEVDIGGFGNPDQVYQAMGEAFRAMAGALAVDLALIEDLHEGVDPLLTSPAGQLMADAARILQVPVSTMLYQAALVDLALALVVDAQGGAALARVQSGDTIAWIGPAASALGLGQSRALAADLAQTVTGNAKRAVALAGRRAAGGAKGGATGGPGFADAVAVLAGSALRARGAALAIAHAMPEPPADGARALAPEIIWDLLGKGARIGQRLKSQQLIDTAALTARGRGRTIGSPKADLLVRFGVSEWR